MKKHTTQDGIITSIITAIVIFLILAVFGQSQAAENYIIDHSEDQKVIQSSTSESA